MFRKSVAVFVLLFSSLLLAGCSFKKAPAALQIRSTPIASVFIDGKLLGKTPYQASDLKAGDLSIKLIPESGNEPLTSWEGKIKVNGGVLTLVEREFGANDAASSGQVLTLEKNKDKTVASLSVVSDPDGGLIKLDGESKGFAPLIVDKINEGDHEISISKDGFNEKVVNAKAIAGYKLIVNVKLSQVSVASITPTAVPTSTTPAPTVKPGKTTVTPTPKLGAVSPTPTKTSSVVPTSGATVTGYILIKENSVGFLRVRNNPSGTEIAKIQPIDPQKKYPLLEERTGWYKITYEVGKDGWVSADPLYTQKVTE